MAVNATAGSFPTPALEETLTHPWLAILSQHISATVLVSIVLTIVLTRLFTQFTAPRSISTNNGDPKAVPQVPYWIPLLGHLPDMVISATSFVSNLRDTYTEGAFALNFGGTAHNVFYTPGLATALMNQKTSICNAEDVSRKLMQTVFGYPVNELDKYDAALSEILGAYKFLLSEPHLGEMVDKTARLTKGNISNLVTFMDSPVDQMPWEKVSNIRVLEGQETPTVEADLLQLVRDFCAHTANPSLMGSDFLHQFPDFFSGIWTMDRGFLLLATGLPRWFPIPDLTRAHIARRQNLAALDTFHENLKKHHDGKDVDSKWSSMDDIGALLKARIEIYEKYNFSIRARASAEHALMWASNANSNALVFWMITRIYADRALLAMLREEIAPHVKIALPEKTGLPISEVPRIDAIDVDSLCSKCPLLKSCYIECLRLDSASWSMKVVQKDFVLQSREKDGQSWKLRKGECAHAAHDLHNTDPKYFERPEVFKPDRHVKTEESGERVADMGSIRPYGGGVSMCKGRAFALKESLLFAAAIISMWEFEPADGKKWKIPGHRKATSVYGTNDSTRVLVRRRQFPTTAP
ncbi:unnamed protein product [Zymoseptoria tritici ST99CH_1E4]|uniref:Cytochrome P450 n=1 Tax=Zymoseptoria tritici ST99CH_1E4 TaxID=1276532 RepID=A0A2H1GU76_ZYMTR|nr:unnamed protein product [Zymoseptoria tritici ST99CH_1E4]